MHPMTDRPRLFTERCATCVFRPGNAMRLPPGRLGELIGDNRATGSLLTCHETTYGQRPDLGEVMCRGFYDAYAEDSAVAQIMGRLFGPDWFEEIPPPAEEAQA